MPGVIGSWSRDYQYDGFGNLTSDGAASWGVDGSTNRLTSGANVGYDANGNLTKMPHGTGNATSTYDLENRMVESTSQPGVKYGYGPDNRRMWIQRANGTEEWQFWGPNGEVLASYSLAWDWTYAQPYFDTRVSQKNWFGAKELGTVEDRLGSKLVSHGAMKFRNDHLPYGSSYTASAGYATYSVDSPGSTQYADQRSYQASFGRFMTPDPYRASGGAAAPMSWNRFAYVEGDPVNLSDEQGLFVSVASLGRLEAERQQPTLAACMVGGVHYPGWHINCRMGWWQVGVAGPQTEEDVLSLVSSLPMTESERAASMLGDAVAYTVNVVLAKKECRSLFQGKDPRDVLTAMFGRYDTTSRSLQGSSFSFGTLGGGAGAQTEVSGLGTPGGSPATNGNGFTYAAGAVRIDTTRWVNQSVMGQAEWLIHELGHVFNMVTGIGSSTILYDVDVAPGRADDAGQEWNRAYIKSKCF